MHSQSYQVMTENKSMAHESLKASYNAQFIKNRKTQDIYDIKMSIKNIGFDLIKFKNRIGEVEYDQSEYWLAKLTFANSTGSNLTLREGYVDSKEFKQRVAFKCDDIERSKYMVLGYGLRRGQTINTTFRIRVPKGESPVVEIQFVNFD